MLGHGALGELAIGEIPSSDGSPSSIHIITSDTARVLIVEFSRLVVRGPPETAIGKIAFGAVTGRIREE